MLARMTNANIERGRRIKMLREQAGYTQAALAALVGVSDSAIQQWQRGTNITWPHVRELARVFNKTPQFILNGDERPEPAAGDDLDERVTRIEERLFVAADHSRMLREHDQFVRQAFGVLGAQLDAFKRELEAVKRELENLTALLSLEAAQGSRDS
jgi:transcriptional regulator with XRE-family HTH domain